MQLEHRWDSAHYAAVSGKFDDKEQAGEILIEHIFNAYNSLSNEFVNCPGNHYSLYWQNGGFQSDKHRDHLASLIQQAMLSGARVHWLVHGEGAGTFVRALQLLKKQLSPEHPPIQSPVPEDSVEAERQKVLGQYLSRQKVFFSNPRGAGTEKVKLQALCKDVGISYAGININPYDMRNADNRNAALSKATAIAGNTFFGGLGATLGIKVLKDSIDQAIFAQSVGIAAGALIAGYFVVRDKIKTNSGYFRALPRAISSTFGKGNQRWAA